MRTMGAGVAEVYRERWPVVWGRWRSVVGAVVAVLRCCTAPTHLGSWPRFPQPTSRPQVLTLWIETDQFVTLGQLGSVFGDFFGLVIGHEQVHHGSGSLGDQRWGRPGTLVAVVTILGIALDECLYVPLDTRRRWYGNVVRLELSLIQLVVDGARFDVVARGLSLPNGKIVSHARMIAGGVLHGVQVERATVRTTWTPWAASARLCLGRWWTGWELPAHAATDPRSRTAPPPLWCAVRPPV
jgi:hypothetical protein